ncbi:MAG: hypothetical protein C6P37_15140 [Caldibacillus debilis]|uniref:Uncharacterized protein n=1 Tax=Caldibacillus debilis TaxID=301148 RepID=A0A3E0JXZ2_9BACI|nr:MAG: hypothetical protein C6W57_16450 [Caldibacillus debilis]REJ25125.1 MAG: hypothetical protein C6P37_15140 [Caldibacillus debilis]
MIALVLEKVRTRPARNSGNTMKMTSNPTFPFPEMRPGSMIKTFSIRKQPIKGKTRQRSRIVLCFHRHLLIFQE